MCPRRIFEEAIIDGTIVPPPKPPEKLKVQIKQLQDEKGQLQEMINQLAKRIETLEKKN